MAIKRPQRSTETSILVRMSRAEKSALETATSKAAESLPAGARLPTYAFVLTAALDRAKSLGVTVDAGLPAPFLPSPKRGKKGSR